MPRLPQPRNRKEAEGNTEFARAYGGPSSFKVEIMERHGLTTDAEWREWVTANANDHLFGSEDA